MSIERCVEKGLDEEMDALGDLRRPLETKESLVRDVEENSA